MSSGRESRECVYSVRSAREWAVLAGEEVTVVDDTGGLGGPMEDMFWSFVAVVAVVVVVGRGEEQGA